MVSHFLLWDPSTWHIIYAQCTSQALSLRYLSVCSSKPREYRPVPQSSLSQRRVSNVLNLFLVHSFNKTQLWSFLGIPDPLFRS